MLTVALASHPTMSRRSASPPNPPSLAPQRPTAKRSPSILVTDSRQHAIKGARAPFAGHNFRKQQAAQQKEQSTSSSSNSTSGTSGSTLPPPRDQHQQQQPLFSQSEHEGALHKRFGTMKNRYTDISVDKLLSNSLDIPLGQLRLPLLLSSTKRIGQRLTANPSVGAKRNIRSIPKLTQLLPLRTSKTSQKLVLIPDEDGDRSPGSRSLKLAVLASSEQGGLSLLGMGSRRRHSPPEDTSAMTPEIDRLRAELMLKDERAHEFSRTTAYFMCEEFNLLAVSKFLKTHHGVKPRLYEEALYVPYALPLLPGTDGYRVKSNNLAKLLPNMRNMEKLINKLEQTNHLYEYYLGVETPEHAGNYSMDPEELDQSTPFDPLEPQFFSPPNLTDNHHGENGDNGVNGRGNDNALLPDKSKDIQDTELQKKESSGEASTTQHHGEMFVFAYGIVVFWNFTETHEKNILADLAFALDDDLLINPINEQDIETEEFHFDYDPTVHRPRIYNDMITLRSGDHLIKLTMSHAIAQLTKLCLFESRIVNNLQLISKLPKKLALTGSLGLKRTQLLKKSGKIFKLKVDVNLLSLILDTPDFFWDLEPALHPLYTAVRDYLEIDQRVQVINDRCKVFLEFADIVADSINEKNTNRVAWMIIIIIFLSLAVSLFEFVLEIVRNH